MNPVNTNGYVAPSSLSVTYMNFKPGNNWGVATDMHGCELLAPHAVIFNPIMNTHVGTRPNRRKVMSDAAKEFAAANRDLLRELAR